MKDLKKYFKNNKLTVITFILCFIFVIFVFIIKLTFFPNENKAIYGKRLEGIDEVEITTKKQENLESILEEKEEIKTANCDLKGKILNIIITVTDETNLETAKNISNIILENLDEEELKFYDIQIFIKKTSEDEKFPIIGYKHQDKEGFTWSKDR